MLLRIMYGRRKKSVTHRRLVWSCDARRRHISIHLSGWQGRRDHRQSRTGSNVPNIEHLPENFREQTFGAIALELKD